MAVRGDATRRLAARLAAVLLAAAVSGCATLPSPSPIPTLIASSQPPSPSIASSSSIASSPEPTASPTASPTPSPTRPLLATPPRGIALRGPALTVPILYMHIVRPIPPDIASWPWAQQKAFLAYMLTPCEFGADLDWLAANGYHTILPRDLAAHWDRGRALPAKPILLTFDDGSPDWAATVLPMLVSHHMVAEFYVDIGMIGTDITWGDLTQLRDAGMGIGAHDMTHVQLVVGGRELFPIATMRYQVAEAKRVLESHLGIKVDSMAYVGGGYDATLMQLARQAGYLTARSIVRGTLQSPSLRFQLRVSRPAIYDDVIGKTVANALSCTLDPALTDFQARVSGSNPG